MLHSIHIENIALMKKLDIPFNCGFSAFTGETGAGKSIIIDSIGAICGNRITKELIRSGEEYALVEAIFSDISEHTKSRCKEYGIEPDDDGFLYISRRISADGKSICRINSRQVPSGLVRDLSTILINIHGQHDNQDLMKKEKQLIILDAYANCCDIYNEYIDTYNMYKLAKKEYQDISIDDAQKQRTIEMLKFQIEEISSLSLKPDEEEKLNIEKNRLSNSEKLTENALTAYGVLYGNNLSAVESMDIAMNNLKNLSKITDTAEEMLDILQRCRSDVYDIAEKLNDLAEDTDEDPTGALDKIEKRLYDIYKLKRKYGNDIPTILEYLENAQKKLSDLELNDIKLTELENKIKELEKQLLLKSGKLSKARKDAAQKLKEEIEKELEFLDMAKVKFIVKINEKECSADGADDIEFMVQTNVGLPYSPLAKTASGGELSRIMLAIKSVIAKKDGVDTVIFDEIDTGISGKTSRRIGIKLLETSKHSQVMCVTHSAQIASLSNSHYKVSKYESCGTTLTDVKLLSMDERIDEIARIISGINITDTSRATALELITDSKKY